MVTTETRSTVINTTLVGCRLESSLRAVSRLHATHWAVGTLRAALRNSAVVVAELARLTHCALTDLLSGSCVGESANGTEYW
jgi:hypothetical protein